MSQPATPVSVTRPAFTKSERNLTLGAVLVVFLLGALDNTIVSTAMPRIIADLNGLSLYTWVTTAYLLASTVMVPIYGKLSDMYGRKPILTFGVSLFLVGSMLCGLAGEFGPLPLLGSGMTQLIIFRALQGLGGAALFSSAFAIIADIFPPAERGRYQGLFGGVFGLASVLGPIIGGFFTDHGTVTVLGYLVAGWRWVFYVNVPLGLVALYLIATQMPLLKAGVGGGKIDFAGAGLILSAFVPLLLGLTWGGSTYPWTSPTILILFGVAALSLVAFVVVELRVKNPILPLELFRVPVFSIANAASFIINIAFLGIIMFFAALYAACAGHQRDQLGLYAVAADGRSHCEFDTHRTARDPHRTLQTLYDLWRTGASRGRLYPHEYQLGDHAVRSRVADGDRRDRPRSGAKSLYVSDSKRGTPSAARHRNGRKPVFPADRLDHRSGRFRFALDAQRRHGDSQTLTQYPGSAITKV